MANKTKKAWYERFIPTKEDSKAEINRKVTFLIALVVLIGAIIVLAIYLKDSRDDIDLNREIESIYSSHAAETTTTTTETTTEAPVDTPFEMLPEMVELYERNNDTVGWVSIEDTPINYVVVMNEDDTAGEYFYTEHDFDGNPSRAGTIFADFRTTFQKSTLGLEQSDNVVLYGHNQMDGSMFAYVGRYRWDISVYKNHPIIEFNTNYEKGQYIIIGYFVAYTKGDYGDDFDYHNYIDFDRPRYEDFIEKIAARNFIDVDIDTEFGDHFVTLSTCATGGDDGIRVVVIGRKLRDGETPEDFAEAVANASYNPDPLFG